MALEFLESHSEPHQGYGAGPGSIDTYIYKCPCGKGRVVKTKDNIPGFRESDILIECDDCREKYGLVNSLSELE